MEFFDEKLKSLCMQWLEDQVYSIREAAATNLKRLAEEFGAEWAQSQILPMIMDKVNNSNYLYRMTVLLSLSMLAPVLGAEATCNTMLPVILNAVKDGVPNIRFNVAKMLQSFIPIVEPSVVEQTIRPCLLELNEDPDPDVRYFANQALQACDQVMVLPDTFVLDNRGLRTRSMALFCHFAVFCIFQLQLDFQEVPAMAAIHEFLLLWEYRHRFRFPHVLPLPIL
ncbi:unnamed protein product [Closterium sp. Naga37s-1]|nr:unnamed protein product [Closterium sp. Naga37s-1]